MKRLAQLWWGLVRFGFRLLYNEFAWTYDVVSWTVSLGNWRQWQRASIPYLHSTPDSLVLELAHGTGNLQLDLDAAGISAIGFDLSRHMGRIASRKLCRKGIQPRLVLGSAMKLPFLDDAFDAIVSTFPTEFMIDPNTLLESRRVLTSTGRLIFVPNGMLSLTGPLTRFLEWLYNITGQRGPWPVDPLVAFRKAGFDAQLIVEEMPHSQVWIIIAAKSALPYVESSRQ